MRRLEQTFCPAGAGEGKATGSYKHSAPLGQGRGRWPGPTNILPRWGREEEGGRALQTFCPAGAGKREATGPYKHSSRFVARFSKMDQEVSTVLSQARRVCWPGDIQPIRTRRRIGLRARQSESEGID
jgi:hypothetical protein